MAATKQGWGVGYGTVSQTNPAKKYTDKNEEIARTTQVIQNRSAQGMDNTAQFQHYQNLTGKAYAPAPVTTPKYAPPPPIDTNQYRTQAATIEDIASKYGFDYSRDYAKRQAELIKQQKQDGLNETKKRAENDLVGAATALDRNYFQQMLQQQQNQATNGLNGALAADQSLRSNMARQASMGDMYRDNAAVNYEVNNALGRLASEATAYEDELYNSRRQEGFNNAMSLNDFNQRDNLARMQADLQQRGQNIDISQFQANFDRQLGRDTRSDFESDRGYNRGVFESDRGFNEDVRRDTRDYSRGVFESDRGYNRGVLESDRGYNLDLSKFDWSKYMDGQNLGLSRQRLAAEKAATQSMANVSQQQQSQWNDLLKDFIAARESDSTPVIDKYYAAIDKVTGGKMDLLYEKYGLQPPTIRDNKFLTDWDRMKLIGG